MNARKRVQEAMRAAWDHGRLVKAHDWLREEESAEERDAAEAVADAEEVRLGQDIQTLVNAARGALETMEKHLAWDEHYRALRVALAQFSEEAPDER